MVVPLPAIGEALGSISSTTNKKKLESYKVKEKGKKLYNSNQF
jgi:hypothetical protein